MVNKKILKIDTFYYTLSFFLPFITLGITFMWFGIYPFGGKSVLIRDLNQQYIQFFNYYYDVFKGDKSLFYSWQAGMGMNFFGIFGYYLASPFNPLLLIFKRDNLPDAVAFLMLFKVGLSGLTMSIYLGRIFKLREINLVLFSAMYALMGYQIIYLQNIMWLDGVIFLPIVLLGIEYLLLKNRISILTISLCTIFISNFYISYMVGIFSFLYIVARFNLYYDWRELKLIISKLSRYLLSVLFAAGLSAVVVLPTYLALKETTNKMINLKLDLSFSFKLINLYTKLYNGMINLKFDLPNIYISLMPLLLIPLFYKVKEISRREKIIYSIICFVLVLSFELPFLNLIWHGFDIPNLYPYRYSFVFSFLMIIMSLRAYCVLEKKYSSYLVKVFLFNVLMIAILNKISPELMTGKRISINLILITGLFGLLYLKINISKAKSILNIMMLGVILFDLSINSLLTLRALDHQGKMKFLERNKYTSNLRYEDIFRRLQKQDKYFYRVESERTANRFNEAFIFDYKGIRHFSSMLNLKLVRTLNKLGYTTYHEKWVSSKGGTLLTDSIFGLKYIIDDKPINRYGYKKINQQDNLNIYQNINALSLGFMTKGIAKTLNYSEDNPFRIQNELINLIDSPTGNIVKEKLFTKIIPAKTIYNNIQVKKINGIRKVVKINTAKEANITYLFNVKGNKQFYCLIKLLPREIIYKPMRSTVSVNGKFLSIYPGMYNNQVYDLGLYNNQAVKVILNIRANSMIIKRSYFYTLDLENFQHWVDNLRERQFVVDSWDSKSLRGHIYCNQSGVLFLSVPYDRGWSIFVDGRRIKPQRIAGDFIGINLTAGMHKIRMSYVSPGFYKGIIISFFSLLLFLITCNYHRLRFIKKVQSN